MVDCVGVDATLAQQVDERAGSTEPERVAIGTPSSGVKPIVVSTERPSRDGRDRAAAAEVAHDEAQLAAGRPSSAAARSTDHATERPWKPYRRTPHSSRQRRGIA